MSTQFKVLIGACIFFLSVAIIAATCKITKVDKLITITYNACDVLDPKLDSTYLVKTGFYRGLSGKARDFDKGRDGVVLKMNEIDEYLKFKCDYLELVK